MHLDAIPHQFTPEQDDALVDHVVLNMSADTIDDAVQDIGNDMGRGLHLLQCVAYHLVERCGLIHLGVRAVIDTPGYAWDGEILISEDLPNCAIARIMEYDELFNNVVMNTAPRSIPLVLRDRLCDILHDMRTNTAADFDPSQKDWN